MTINKNVWIVSSDPQLAPLMEKLLKKEGHTVTKFTMPEAAIETLNDTPIKPDLIITDNLINGVEDAGMPLLREAKKACVQTIMQSSETIKKTMATSLGALFIQKPYISNEYFTNTVKNVLAQSAHSTLGFGGR